jgi:3-oxoacyl-[acyl-carrier-protein] synthase II
MVQTSSTLTNGRADGPTSRASICGVGAVTGYGWGAKHLWDGLLLGESAVTLVTGLEGYVNDGEAYLSLISDDGDPKDGPSRFMRAFRASAREAVADAVERGWKPGGNVGVVHSIAQGDTDIWSEFYQLRGARIRPKRWVNMLPSTVISQMMKEFDFHGPAVSVSAMCASANAGIITAKSWLDAGIATDVILLATDLSGTPELLRPFSDLGVAVLNRPPFDACRPFQEGSRGFVGGEASVAMVLSRNPTGSYADVVGGAMTMDASNLVGLDPDLTQIVRCFREALATAHASPDEVACLNAHGPGTAQCDVAEGTILDDLFPDAQGLFSIKPLVGHCQSAAAAVEVLATIYTFQTGFIPAPRQVAPGHPRLIAGHTPAAPGLVLKSALGMGGYNTVSVIDRPPT